jgi:transposase InsO family protein
MEDQYFADRTTLRQLLRTHPEWTQREMAASLGRSVAWVKKWVKRLRAAPPDDTSVLRSRSRARHHPPPRVAPAVVERILEIRDQPPEGLRRTPGPKAILYYLHRDAQMQALGGLPRAPRTIWRILVQQGRIARPDRPAHEPLERPAPLTSWQLDFKDASTVPADPDGKHSHVVEVLNAVDVGTSLLLAAHARADFTAETSIHAVATLVRDQGLPDQVTFDRDPRFVGSAQSRDFPAPFVRFWTCLGVAVTVCPPHHPQDNAFVERYHRSYNQECLRVERPTTLEEVRIVTAAYKEHYNWQRPNQALSCANRPPRIAFPVLPPRPSIPLCVDPDAWLYTITGRAYVRRVSAGGFVAVGDDTYYIQRSLAGQEVAVQVDAPARELVITHRGYELRRLPIKGLVRQILPFDAFVDHLATQARTERQPRLAAAG